MAHRSAFSAMILEDEAVIGQAVEGASGPVADRQLGTFPTWTQANAFAQRLNEGLDLTASDALDIVIDAMLEAAQLIEECNSLQQNAKLLRLRLRKSPERLDFAVAGLQLAFASCHHAAALPHLWKERIIRLARKTIADAMSAACRTELNSETTKEVVSAIERLEDALAALDDSLK